MIPELNYNNKILSTQERDEFCKFADGLINDFAESIDGMYQIAMEVSSTGNSAFNEITDTTISISTFINFSFCDCIVLTKLFVRATNPYEKSFLRGKLKVQLNESFKKLYGFTDKGYKDSYCAKLEKIILMFPAFKDEFNAILSDLKQISKKPWWKEERNVEVHIDIAKLYESRHEEINESKVAMETLQLTNAFNRFNRLMTRLNRVYIAYMASKLQGS
ncbi:hypothetical protein KG007_13730 [Alistipes sp. kh20]|uniref:hypothetical protein n=1 Tax=Alistipes montrealensis TaxID=2834113 RepID=UPI001BCD0D2E|nr:hypothetical protein [Alistipes montrealensis]MBS4767259.1 hypothetical protein [Alistipes montrealensis]